MHRLGRLLLAGWLTFGGADPLAAQSKATLETKVYAEGRQIVLEWGKKHPWSEQLGQTGASVMAYYRTQDGVGRDCLQPGSARQIRRGGRRAPNACRAGLAGLVADRIIRFRLPDKLEAVPVGPVCLQIRTADSKPLPIRRAGSGPDTTLFQYPEWAQAATARTEAERIGAERRKIQTALAAQETSVAEQARINQDKGWGSLDGCETLSGGRVELSRSERPIAPPPQQDMVARMMCVIRIKNGDGCAKCVKPLEPRTRWLEEYVEPEKQARWRELRAVQLKQFIDDLSRFGPKVKEFREAFPTPHFGTYTEKLYQQSLAVRAGRRAEDAIRRGKKPREEDVLGLIGSTVESYDRCVRDGRRQLQLNYEQSRALDQVLQSLPERLREQAVGECRDAVMKLAQMQEHLEEFQRDLEHMERRMAEIKPGLLPARTGELNFVTCIP